MGMGVDAQEELSWEQVEAAIWDDDVEYLEPHIQTNFNYVYADTRTGFLLEVRARSSRKPKFKSCARTRMASAGVGRGGADVTWCRM